MAADPGQTLRLLGANFCIKTPLSPEAQSDIVKIQTAAVDYMPGLSQSEKKSRLTSMSYKDFLLNVVKAHPATIPYYQTDTHGLYGIGIDAVPALDCWAIGFPGFQGMGLDRTPTGGRLSFTALGAVTPQKGEYTFHFPDGNASIARMLVRSLIPAAIPGQTAEDIVTAGTDYSKLDNSSSPIKIRLSSTVVRVRHLGEPASAKEVEITYATPQGQLSSVRGQSRGHGLLEHGYALSLSRTTGEAKNGLEIRLQSPAGVHSGGDSQLVLILEIGNPAGRNSRDVPHIHRTRQSGEYRGL